MSSPRRGLHDHVTVVAEGVVDTQDASGVVKGFKCPAP